MSDERKITNAGSGLIVTPTFKTERAKKMADLNADGISPANPVVEKKDKKGKVTRTERKPIQLDKPQVTSNQIQVHQGNIGVLQVKFLESVNNAVQDIRGVAREIRDLVKEIKNG